eukprot:scaffold40_cov68-Cyclotella_meneghiniana.AAC.3
MKLSTLAVIAWATPTSAQSTLPAPIPCDGDFNSGVYLGADVAEAIWKAGGSSCSNIWGYEDAVDDYLDEYYPDDTGNWKTDACHDGMEKGADQVVAKYEKMCLDDTPDECYDLGQTAAQIIAFDYCPFSAADEASATSAPDYKESCKEVATSICEGAVYNYVKQNGCSPSTSELAKLQDKCDDQVESMVGGDEEKEETAKVIAFDGSADKTKEESSSVELTEELSCSDFNTGVYHGADVAEHIWKKNGSSCGYVWNFQDDVDAYLKKNYPTDTSDWKTNSCNQGVAAGAQQVVDKYEKQCLNDTPDECNDLGQTAAQTDESSTYSTPNYKKTCRSVAYGICEGSIYGYVRENGCSISTSKLSQLQGKCEDQVDSMTGGEEVAIAMTRHLRKNN